MQFSVLMSIYYKENPRHLKSCLISTINNSIKPDEILLIKDGPLTTELDQIIDKYDKDNPGLFHIIQLDKNGGLGAALRLGVEKCKYDLIARMDTDDICVLDRFKLQLLAFENDSELDIVGGIVEEFDYTPAEPLSMRITPEQHKDIIKYAKFRSPFNHPAVMYKKQAVLDSGNYVEFPLFEDYCLWINMIQNGKKTANIPQILVYMRAGNGLFKRRGGVKYFKTMAKFRYHMHKIGYTNIFEFLFAVTCQGIVCMVPTSVRGFIMKSFGRK